jgi:hypothetical protein
MDIHHDTSFRFILEDDAISLASRARVYSCLGKGAVLWVIIKLSICSFHIAHFTFISTSHFCLNLIQPSAVNFFTCECGHGLNAFGMHLTRCLFGGQYITTHDAIRDAMYALARKSGHIVWKEWWYIFMLKVSL